MVRRPLKMIFETLNADSSMKFYTMSSAWLYIGKGDRGWIFWVGNSIKTIERGIELRG